MANKKRRKDPRIGNELAMDAELCDELEIFKICVENKVRECLNL